MAIEAVLRPATKDDVPALVELERDSFPVPNWPADTFLRYDCTVAEVSGKVGGFLVSRQIFAGNTTEPAEREILNLAVAPPFRRSGIATSSFNWSSIRGYFPARSADQTWSPFAVRAARLRRNFAAHRLLRQSS